MITREELRNKLLDRWQCTCMDSSLLDILEEAGLIAKDKPKDKTAKEKWIKRRDHVLEDDNEKSMWQNEYIHETLKLADAAIKEAEQHNET